MENATRGWTLEQLAKLLEGSLEGSGKVWITGPATAEGGGDNTIAFAETEEYLSKAISSNVEAIITYRDAPASSKPYIRVDHPKQSFGKFLGLCAVTMPIESGIHPTAIVHPSAKIAESARIGPYVVIQEGCQVDSDAKIHPFVFVGANSSVGKRTILYPHVVLYGDISVGEDVIIHSNAVLGSDGFGFTWNGEEHLKVPHLGKVRIESDVEIGSCTTIDRAMLGETVIGRGTKIDNQVQIGHNTTIGKHGIVASQTGISGSCTIGDRCTFAGQVGMGDHVRIVDDVIMTARSAVASDIREKGPHRGQPALPLREELRIEASVRKLPQILKRLKELEKAVERLNSNNDS